MICDLRFKILILILNFLKMTKKIFLLSMMLLSLSFLNAQSKHSFAIENQYPGDSLMQKIYKEAVVHQLDSTTAAVRNTWVANRFRDNWFISINGGLGQLMSEETRYMDLKDQVKPTFGFSLGKWFSPVWGLRLNVTGANLQGFATWQGDGASGSGLGDWYIGKNYPSNYGANPTNNYLPAWGIGDGNDNGRALIYNRFLKGGKQLTTAEGPGYTYDMTYVGASVDFLLNLKNFFTSYNHNAFFNPVIYAGPGYAHTFKDKDDSGEQTRTAINSIMIKTGMQLNFRLSDRWDVFADGQLLFLPEVFDRRVGDGNTFDAVGNYTVGLTYRFNARHFIKAPVYDQSLIDRLNAEINELRKRPVSCPPVVVCPECPTCPDCPEIDQMIVPIERDNLKFLPTPVFFLINKYDVRDTEWTSVMKAAEYLKLNPTHRLKLTGYADKQTGTPAINKRLSEQRAKAVADVLVTKFGIDRSRLDVTYMGDTFQPFAENDWNRVVIFVVP